MRAGFVRRAGRGSHRVFVREGLMRPIVIPDRNPVRVEYVRVVIDAIEEVLDGKDG